MKLIDSDKAYGILDKLFINIQKNGYVASQQMLDKAWKAWCELPTAYNVDKVAFRLECESINCHIMTDRAVEIVKSGGIE